MAGDYTRFTFNAANNYSGVYKQQGRVSLDADWNEGVEIDDRRWRSETFDVIGRCTVPETTPDAFRIAPTAPGAFDIGVGRCYLDGIQTENHGLPPLRYDAILGEQRGTSEVPYSDQPWLPAPLPPALDRPELPPLAGRTDLVYLDVWQREVSAIEDPTIQEIALGGADTATRMQSVWQVRALADIGDAHCPDDIAAWNDLIRPSAGRLSSAAVATPSSDDPCELPPSGGYRGLENRLYRVEVHTPGTLGSAKFKWSRDNASLVARVEAIAAGLDQITVHQLGRDQHLRFRLGDWVEVTDDHLEFQGQAGHVAQISAIDEANRILTLAQPVPVGLGLDATNAGRHTRVRRWDQRNGVDANGLLDVLAGPIALEDGVEVAFSLDPDIAAGEFKIGDSWVFAARTADGSVQELSAAPPRAIKHHYCRLAVVHWGVDLDSTRVHDCRHIWPPAHCCTIAVRPGEDIQGAIDRLPADGGCVCLLPGLHRVDHPLLIDARQNVLLHGVGDASKLIYEPIPGSQDPHRAALYIVGGSRAIEVRDLLLWSDSLNHLIAVDEGSRAISINRATLINAAVVAGERRSAIVLAHCCDVSVEGCRIVAHIDIVQAVPDIVLQLRQDLEGLRPAPVNGDGDTDVDVDVDGDGVTDDVEEPPQAPPLLQLEGLSISANTLWFSNVGVRLHDAVDGLIEDNRLRGIETEVRGNFQRPVFDPVTGDELAEAPDLEGFYLGLDDAVAALAPCRSIDATSDGAPLPPAVVEGTHGVEACVIRDFVVSQNHIEAGQAILFAYSRKIVAADNRISTQRHGVVFGYAFHADLRDNVVRLARQAREDHHREDNPWRVRLARLRPGNMAIATYWAFGLRVRDNSLYAPTGIGVSRSGVEECEHVARESLLQVMGLTRIWNVSMALIWFFYQLFQLLAASGDPANAGPGTTREEFEDTLDGRLRGVLTGSWLRPFVGKAAIDDNQMQTTRFGVWQQSFLTLGGIRIHGNRITCADAAAIQQHPWFSVGLTETVAGLVRCAMTWLLAILVLLRDALAAFLEEQEQNNAGGGGFIGIVVIVISWIMVLCARLCGEPADEGGDGETEPHNPVIDLKDALDDFLNNANLCWLDDVVNQRYVIDNNTIAGSGDGIWTGLDGSHINDNTVTVWPRSSVPYETVALGLLIRQHFESAAATDYYGDDIDFYARSLLELDRDWIFFTGVAGGTWVGDNVDDAAYRTLLRNCITEWAGQIEGGSPMQAQAAAMLTGLDESNLDTGAVMLAWGRIYLIMIGEIRGYGIAMLGADMSCRNNEVRAKAACGGGLFEDEANEGPGIAVNSRQLIFAYPAIGGIWQFSNLFSLLIELSGLFIDEGLKNRTFNLIGALLSWLLLLTTEEREQRVNANQIETALVHGIRSLGVLGMEEAEIMDNTVRNAWRHGIFHRHSPIDTQFDDFHSRVHRNSVHRSSDSRSFGRLNQTPSDFASLIWVEHGAFATLNDLEQVTGSGTALLSHNHGDGAGLWSQQQAVYVLSTVAAVNSNHILTVSSEAFHILANQGLFTDNLMNRPNFLSSSSLEQGPNVTV